MSEDRLSISQAARLLNVSEATVARWIRQGLFHGVDHAGRWIERDELLRWAHEHGIAVGARRRERPTPAADLLASAVERGAVTMGCDPESAAAAIEIAIDAVPGLRDEDREELLAQVLERERMASTGLGMGVALPHPRKPPAHLIDEPVISVVFPERTLDWAALDGEPVYAVLLVLSPSAPVHLEILARVAFVLRSPELRDLLRERPSQEQLVARLRSVRMGQ